MSTQAITANNWRKAIELLLETNQSSFSSADIGDACCGGEAERWRAGDADDARDDEDDNDAERDLVASFRSLSLASLSAASACDFELAAFSL